MRVDQAAPTLFSAFYKRLFYELFEDELGPELARAYRAKANLSAIMVRAVFEGRIEHWFDRVDTPETEDRNWVLRSAFEKAVGDLTQSLGGPPASWTWGRVHTLELAHPLGKASRLLGFYFNRGPFPLAGHTSTVNKGEFAEEDFRVVHGPSMRQITDLADLGRALAVIPSGQSGIPASRHYDDLLKLWLTGEYHPFLMDRPEIEKVAEGRLVLEP
jgi:penicillin amidase